MTSMSGWQRLTGWVPGLRLFSHYERSFLAGDLTAGLVVALVVIPTGIAYADLANCPPVSGLYAAGCQFFRFTDRDGSTRIQEITTCVSERIGSDKYTNAAPSTSPVGRVYTPPGVGCPAATIVQQG